MSLKKYDELSDEEKHKVTIMYSDQSTVQSYLYNFEGDRYIGRQYYASTMTVRTDPLVEEEKEEVKEEVKEVEKEKPVKKSKRNRK